MRLQLFGAHIQVIYYCISNSINIFNLSFFIYCIFVIDLIRPNTNWIALKFARFWFCFGIVHRLIQSHNGAVYRKHLIEQGKYDMYQAQRNIAQ